MVDIERITRELLGAKLPPSRSQPSIDLGLVDKVATMLWSEATRQLETDAQNNRAVDERMGIYRPDPDQYYAVPHEKVFRRYRNLVTKYIVDSHRPKKHMTVGEFILEFRSDEYPSGNLK